MIRYLIVAFVFFLPAVRFVFAAPQRVVFEGADIRAQVGTEGPQPRPAVGLDRLRLPGAGAEGFLAAAILPDLLQQRCVQRRQMQPLPNVWIRAAVPLQYYRQPNRAGFDLASVGKVPRNSFWISTGGVYGPLNAVEAIGVTMQAPLGKPTLEIRSVRLSKEDPGSDILDKKPVVDEFGQWIPADWPGKVKSLDQLKKEWAAEEAGLRAGDFGYCKYGGYLNTKAKATGFFRVEQVDGRWWFVDPDGHLFFSTSSTGMRQRRRRRAPARAAKTTSRRCRRWSRPRPDAARRRASTPGTWRGGTARIRRQSGSTWRSGGWNRGA